MNYKIPLALLDAGLSFIPVHRTTRLPVAKLLPISYDENGEPITRLNEDGKSYTVHEYKTYMNRQPTQDEVMVWFGRDNDYNIAVLSGKVSGGLVILDFDYDADITFVKWKGLVTGKSQNLVSRLLLVRSGKGYHVYFRCPEFSHKNNCLARRNNPDKPKSPYILIEIKSTLPCTCPPSWHDGVKRRYEPIQGSLRSIATLSLEEANILLECATSLNELEEKEYKPEVSKSRTVGNVSFGSGQVEGWRILAYSRAILRGLAGDLANIDGYRNATLNSSAFILGTWHNVSGLSYGECESALRSACEQNGLIRDNGQHSFIASMQSGWKAGLLQAKTAVDIEAIFSTNEAPFPDGELTARFQDVHPPLSEEQLAQVVQKAKEIREEALWQGFHNGMEEAHRRGWIERYGFDKGIQSIFSLGYRRGYLDTETGEIVDSAYTVPMTGYEGQVVNVEYRLDSGEVRYQQETLPTASYLVNEYFPAMEDKPVLIFSDTLTAMDSLLTIGTFNYAGLPQLPLIPETFDTAPDLQHILVIDPKQKRHNINMKLLPKGTKSLRLPYGFNQLRPLFMKDGEVDKTGLEKFVRGNVN